ncbi:MAG: hypothetical protein E7607_08260 [Ruminococcaceae bacterium]|nr:hypothetical protein [Oscillospiraceae bacterium]
MLFSPSARHFESSSMQTFSGFCACSADGSPVMGRITFDNGNLARKSGEALLPVLENIPESAYSSSCVVGIVRIGRASDSEPSYSPFPILRLGGLSKCHEGKIALLDPLCGKLYISPDIVTVDRYASRIFSADSAHRLGTSDTVKILSRISKDSDFKRGMDTDTDVLLDVFSPLCAKDPEEGFFEEYRAVAEALFGIRIMAEAEWDSFFSSRIKAILRGAVYGNFSISLRGILCEEDLRNALLDINRAFCSLEAEGREFNGYICRGICIDTPLLLRSSFSCEGIDNYSVDVERLFSLMTGSCDRDDSELYYAFLRELMTALKRRKNLKGYAILGERTIRKEIFHTLLDCNIRCFFARQKHKPAAIRAAEEALSERDGLV